MKTPKENLQAIASKIAMESAYLNLCQQGVIESKGNIEKYMAYAAEAQVSLNYHLTCAAAAEKRIAVKTEEYTTLFNSAELK